MDIELNVHKILENFEVVDLSSLPHVLVELLEACYRVDTSFEQLASWVEMDPALSAKALSLTAAVNAGASARLVSFPEVIKKLGRHTIKALAVSSATRQSLEAAGGSPESIAFWRHSMRCAVTSRLLALATAYPAPDEAYLAGLLHNVGQMVFESIEPGKYAELRHKAQRDTQLLLLEREQFGTGHTELGAELIHSWGLNSFIADAARYHHQPLGYVLDAHSLVQIVFLSNLLSHGESRPLEMAFEAAEELFGLGQGALADIISKAGEKLSELSQTLNIRDDRNVDEAAHESPPANRVTARLARRVNEIALLEGMRPRLHRSSDKQALLLALQRSASLICGDRPSLYFINHPEGALKGLNPLDAEDLITELRIRLDGSASMIARAMLENRLTHSFDEEAPPLSVVDRQVMRRLNATGMLCLPLVGGEGGIGTLVVGMDREQIPRIEAQQTLLSAFAAEASAQLASLEGERRGSDGTAPPADADMRTRQIVHEVNNPLSIVRNYLQVLGMKLGAAHPARQDLEVIEEELVRISELVMKLTDVSPQADASRRETVALNSLVRDLLRISRDSLIVPKEIEVELSLDGQLPPILSSASSLKQVLINLVQNASEAMSAAGRLKIATRDWYQVDATPFVEILVSDDGPGIPPEIEGRIFQPVASTKGAGHAGLGLSIVKKLVEDLGGSIGYQSDRESGTTFRVLLPRVLGERRAEAKPGGSAVRGK